MTDECALNVELYARNEFEFLNLFDKQTAALALLENDQHNEILYGGAARGGKSWLGCLWQLFRRLAFPGSHGMIGREDMNKLKETTMLTFKKVCKFYGAQEGIDFEWREGRKVFFANGSSIVFTEFKYYPIKDPDFDRFGSYDLTDAFIDESQQVHHKARQILKSRFSVLSGEGWKTLPKAFYSCNPQKNWIYSEFYRKWKMGELEGNKEFVPSLPTDNPYTPQEYIENLKTADKITRERLLKGNFDYDDNPDALCDYDAICDIFTNDHVPGGDHFISADLAMQGRDRFVAGHWSGLNGYVDVDEATSTGKEIENTINLLKIQHSVPNSRVVADSDGVGAYLDSYITNIKTFHGAATPKDKKYANMKSQCGFKLAEMINDRMIKIHCTHDQEESIKEELSMCLKRDDVDADKKFKLISKKKMKELLGRSPDYMDWMIMRMYFEIRKEYNIFIN